MSYRCQIIATTALVLLAACGEKAPSENNSSGITVVPALPAFAVDAKTAIARISALGPPWSEATASEPMADPATGGQATVLTGSAGSAQIFSRVEGTVWQVRLVTGTPGSCGEAAPLVAALPKVVDLLKPGTTIDAARTTAITAGLAGAKASTHQLPGMTLTVVGGCTHWLTIAVPV
ncbi:MAG TPA: hypothetical protein VM900_01935 [Sphingomonas sp.]|nr:hypothetical protein [Sphingomonas sp.]